MSPLETVVFVHGLGEKAEVWQQQIDALPEGFEGIAVDLFADVGTTGFSLTDGAARIERELDRRNLAAVHLCGLSLGAMTVLRFALDTPHRVRSLTLAAGQVKPPRMLMRVQRAIMSAFPAKTFASRGLDKTTMLTVLRAVEATDFTADLGRVAAPALVLCGSRDRANLPAARALASGIPAAELRIIDGAGHQAQLDELRRFAQLLGDFLLGAAREERP